MNWQPIRRLYEEHEKVDTVYCSIDKKHFLPLYFANTELVCDYRKGTHSKCNMAMLLQCGHIVVDDCSQANLNGKAFRDEEQWRQTVVTEND